MFYKKGLKYIFIIASAMAICYPLISFYVIFPSFDRLLTNNTEDEAARVAQSLSSIVISGNNELKNPAVFSQTIENARKDFNIEKIKVFSDKGEIIYSTNPKDIGTINKRTYFYEIVAKGEVFTKEVKKGTRTLENRIVTADVIETYVPIMRNGRFLGAFEIYYDITLKNQALNKTVFHSSLLSFVLVFSFFVMIIIALVRTEKSSQGVEIESLSETYQSPFYLLFVMLLSTFSAEAIVMYFLSHLPPMSKILQAVLDASLLVMLVAPLLYFFLLRPLILNINMRKQAEEELRNSHKKLEKLVQERTEELEEANKILGKDIHEREKIENQLRDKMNQLEEFFKIAVGRELRMKNLEEENRRLKDELSQDKR
jgi:hypothetical protein